MTNEIDSGFDLNIGNMLENWTVAHAIREIIANAIDECMLTSSREIEIYDDGNGAWHIRDYGRGIEHKHLTQDENEEKLSHPGLIGKFGVGLKDALATFDRNRIGVAIDSKHGHITIGKSAKHGFSDIVTLHAYIADPLDSNFVGTDFCLTGCTEQDVRAAKDFFLKFSDMPLMESTQYGEIYGKRNGKAEVFINGIKVAEEDNLLFSYNITSLNAALRKAINRERTNVGRGAYSERIRSILTNAKSDCVISQLTDNLGQMNAGTQCDEMKWQDVQTHAVKLLSARSNTVFVTPEEMQSSTNIIDIVQQSGKSVVFIPSSIKSKIENETDVCGNRISTVSSVFDEYNKSFKYDFIDYEQLSGGEKAMFDLVPKVIQLVGSGIKPIQVCVSSTLCPREGEAKTRGVWDSELQRIVILRSELRSREDFIGTLIHELTHADSGSPDVCRDFENALTDRLGKLGSLILSDDAKSDSSFDDILQFLQ